MRLAFISDVHSNIYALRAVIDELSKENTQETYCLGDVVGYLPFASETIKKLKNSKIKTISGNYDKAIVEHSECGCRHDDSKDEKLAERSLDCTHKVLNQTDKQFLSNLEPTMRMKKKNTHLYLFHGMPHDSKSYLEDENDISKFKNVISKQPADVYVFGHVHKPYVKRVESKIFINCGSVGKSEEPGFAQYALVDIDDDNLFVQIMNVPYDIESMKKAFDKSDFEQAIIKRWY